MQDKIEKSKIEFLKTIIFEKLLFLVGFRSNLAFFRNLYMSAIIMQDETKKSKIEFLKTIIFEKLVFFLGFRSKFSFFQEPLYVCYYYAR